jgi:hypothetical protein
MLVRPTPMAAPPAAITPIRLAIEEATTKQIRGPLAVAVACAALTLPHFAAAQTVPAIPPILVTPDTVETRIGKLDFKDGAPSAPTVEKLFDTLDFTHALNAYLDSYGGGHRRMRSVRALPASGRTTTRLSFSPS